MNNLHYSEGRVLWTHTALSKTALIILVLSAIMTAAGIGFALHAMIVGHEHTFGTSRQVPWGILIPSYVFFATMSTGLCIIASLGQVFQLETFKPLAPRAVLLAAITIAAGLMSISLELENPWRVPIYALLSPHPSSNIWWKTSIFSMYLMLLVFNFILLLWKKPKAARVFASLALAACLATNLNMKEDMSMTGARGFWPEQYMAIYFTALAVLLGGCALLLYLWFSDRTGPDRITAGLRHSLGSLGKLIATMLMIMAFFTGWKVTTGLSGQSANTEVLNLLFRDKLAFNFWLGEVLLAVVIPLVIYFSSRKHSLNRLALGGAVSLTGFFFALYNMVIAGQLIPRFSGFDVYGLPRYLNYTPSLHEIMMFGGAVFLVITLTIIGEAYFRPGRRNLIQSAHIS